MGEGTRLSTLSFSTPVRSCADGWQTAYNMVNGMMGAMYLSGRICYADELNQKLIADAIAIYKDNRATLAGAVPIYPTGLSRMCVAYVLLFLYLCCPILSNSF